MASRYRFLAVSIEVVEVIMGWAIETAQHEDIQGNTNIQREHRGSGASSDRKGMSGELKTEASLLKTNIVEYFQVEGRFIVFNSA